MPSPETLRSFASDQFLTGLVFGFGALVFGILVVYVWRRGRNNAAPVVGGLLTVAALLAMRVTRTPSSDLWFGIILLALGGSLFSRARNLPLLPAMLAVPGALWVTRIVDLPVAPWISWLLFGWVIVSAPLVVSFDRHFASRGYGPVLLVVSIAGMFTTLPDTEEILVLFGAALLLPLLAWPKAAASLGAGGTYALLGLMAWVIAFGGRGRESAVIGAIACLGFLVAEPLFRWRSKRTLLDQLPDGWKWVPIAASVQLVLVLLAARVAGLSDTPQRAVLIAVSVFLVAVAFLSVISTRLPSQSTDRSNIVRRQ